MTEIQTLWFGGTIPYFRRERGENVPAVNGTGQPAGRKCGLPECLRTCGVWEYPLVTGGNVLIGRDASRSRGIIPKVGARTSCSCLQRGTCRYQPLTAYDGKTGADVACEAFGTLS